MAEAQRKPVHRDRKILLFIGLIAAIFLSFLFPPGKNSPGKTGSSSSRKALNAKIQQVPDPVLPVEKLKNAPSEVQEIRRNLFAFYEPPPPPPPPPSAAEQMAQNEPEQPPAVCGDQICQPGEDHDNCPTDCQPPPPPEIQLKYIGYLSENNGPVAFLTDGREVFMGRENEIIANKYRVIKITGESVELGYLDLNGTRNIPFQGS